MTCTTWAPAGADPVSDSPATAYPSVIIGSTAHEREGWISPWKPALQVHPAGSVPPASCADRQVQTVWLDVVRAKILPEPPESRTNLTVPGCGLSVTCVSNSPEMPIWANFFSGFPDAIVLPFSAIR